MLKEYKIGDRVRLSKDFIKYLEKYSKYPFEDLIYEIRPHPRLKCLSFQIPLENKDVTFKFTKEGYCTSSLFKYKALGDVVSNSLYNHSQLVLAIIDNSIKIVPYSLGLENTNLIAECTKSNLEMLSKTFKIDICLDPNDIALHLFKDNIYLPCLVGSSHSEARLRNIPTLIHLKNNKFLDSFDKVFECVIPLDPKTGLELLTIEDLINDDRN